MFFWIKYFNHYLYSPICRDCSPLYCYIIHWLSTCECILAALLCLHPWSASLLRPTSESTRKAQIMGFYIRTFLLYHCCFYTEFHHQDLLPKTVTFTLIAHWPILWPDSPLAAGMEGSYMLGSMLSIAVFKSSFALFFWLRYMHSTFLIGTVMLLWILGLRLNQVCGFYWHVWNYIVFSESSYK